MEVCGILIENRETEGNAMSQHTKKPPVWLWFLLPVLMAAEYFGPVLTRVAVAHSLYLDAHPGPGFGQFWMKHLANLAGSMALVLFTLFVCAVVLCYHAERLRARDAVLFTLLACLFSCSGAALFGEMPFESAWVPYVFRATFLLGSGYLLFWLIKRVPSPAEWKAKWWLLLAGMVVLALVALLTVWDVRVRLIEWIARENAGPLSRGLRWLINWTSYKAMFQLVFWNNLSVPWGVCTACAFVLACLMAQKKLRVSRAVLVMAAVWVVTYAIFIASPPLDYRTAAMLQIPRPGMEMSQEIGSTIFGPWLHRLFPNSVFWGIPTSVIQAVWVGASCAVLMLFGRLCGGKVAIPEKIKQ